MLEADGDVPGVPALKVIGLCLEALALEADGDVPGVPVLEVAGACAAVLILDEGGVGVVDDVACEVPESIAPPPNIAIDIAAPKKKLFTPPLTFSSSSGLSVHI